VNVTNVNCPFVQANVPQQKNSLDCGIMVIKNANLFLNQWPTSTKEDKDNRFGNYINPNDYSTDVTLFMEGERQRIRDSILALSAAWMEEEKQKQVAVADDDDDDVEVVGDDDVEVVGGNKKQKTNDTEDHNDSDVVIVNNNN